jgi:hypothetical protein
MSKVVRPAQSEKSQNADALVVRASGKATVSRGLNIPSPEKLQIEVMIRISEQLADILVIPLFIARRRTTIIVDLKRCKIVYYDPFPPSNNQEVLTVLDSVKNQVETALDTEFRMFPPALQN